MMIIFQQFREGGKSIRSNQVHTLAKLFPTYIFPELSAAFSNKAKRCDLPEIIALLHNKRFLYDREPIDAKAALDGHLRNPCILKVRTYVPICLLSHFTKSTPSVDSAVCPAWANRCYERHKKPQSAQHERSSVGMHTCH
jgi:hypothetical protein